MAERHPLARIDLAPLRRRSGSLERLVETRLWARVVLGLFAGSAVGAAIGPSAGWVDPALAVALADWLAPPSDLPATRVWCLPCDASYSLSAS